MIRKAACTGLFLFALSYPGYAQLRMVWEKAYGGPENDALTSVQQMNNGGYLLVGFSQSGAGAFKTAPNIGNYDTWIVKTDRNGNKLSDIALGEGLSDIPYVMIKTADGGFLVGGFSGSPPGPAKESLLHGKLDYWLIRLDAAGNKLWDRSYGGEEADELYGIIEDPDGSLLLLGASASGGNKGNKTTPGLGETDAWIVKTNASGAILWQKTYGGEGTDAALKGMRNSDGTYMIGCYSASATGPNKAAQNNGQSDFWMLKLDASGNRIWDRSYGGPENEQLYDLEPDNQGGYLLAGTKTIGPGNDDFWLLKIDADGNVLLNKTYGGPGTEQVYDVLIGAGGDYLLYGYSSSGKGPGKTDSSRGGIDLWVVRTDDTGKILEDLTLGGSKYDDEHTFIRTGRCDMLLCAASESPASGDKKALPLGKFDYWLIKLTNPAVFPEKKVICNQEKIDIHVLLSDEIPINPGNTYTFELSDSTGSFADPIEIGTALSSLDSAVFTFNLPAAVNPGNKHRLRMIMTSPADTVYYQSAIEKSLLGDSLRLSRQLLCFAGDTATLSGSPANRHRWYHNNVLLPDTASSLSISKPGTYRAAVTSHAGCNVFSPAASVNLQLVPELIGTQDTFMCRTQHMELAASGNAAYQYAWNTGDAAQRITVTEPGRYYLSALYNSCLYTDTVTVSYSPTPREYTQADTLCMDKFNEVLRASGRITAFEWYPTGLYVPVFANAQVQQYAIFLTDIYHCSASDTFTVLNECPQGLYIPDAFTPNGDGINDLFTIHGDLSALSIKIYNAWGEEVFAGNQAKGWDGSYKSMACPAGVYIWQAAYQLKGAKSRATAKGNLTLIR